MIYKLNKFKKEKKEKKKGNEVDDSKFDNHFGIMWCETKLKAKVKDFGHWKHFNKSRALKTLKGDRGLHDFYSISSPLAKWPNTTFFGNF